MNKTFSNRLNQELDKMELPKPHQERIEAFSKLIKVPHFKAESILNGHVPGDVFIQEKIANELEVEFKWLLGEDV